MKTKRIYFTFKALIGTSHDWAFLDEYESFFRVSPIFHKMLNDKGNSVFTSNTHIKLPMLEQVLASILEWLNAHPEEYVAEYKSVNVTEVPSVEEAREKIENMLDSVRLVMRGYNKEAWDYIYVFITH